MYFDEDVVLDVRLNTLDQYVSKFVIVESLFTHKGDKRDLKFDIKKFNKFKNKIVYLVYEKEPFEIESINEADTENEKSVKSILNAIHRENGQRNFISEGLKNAHDEDFILISDLDEIPNLSNINLNNFREKLIFFNQEMFYYKFNLTFLNQNWYGSRICVKKFLKSPQWLRNQKVKKNSFWKFYKIKWNIIKDGGWHFSFLMDANQIKAKLNSFAHEEYNNDYFKNFDNVLDLFGGSGSTMIACEKKNKNCYMMEFEPHYVDVIVKRWEQFTGKKAELENGQK